MERRQVVVPILDEQVEFVTVTESTATQVTMTETEVVTVDKSPTGKSRMLYYLRFMLTILPTVV
jgi:hypothetical protein